MAALPRSRQGARHYRYRFDGKQRTMQIGTYAEPSLAKARKTARALAARVALGYDVVGEKQERKAAALAKMEAERNAVTRHPHLTSMTQEARKKLGTAGSHAQN